MLKIFHRNGCSGPEEACECAVRIHGFHMMAVESTGDMDAIHGACLTVLAIATSTHRENEVFTFSFANGSYINVSMDAEAVN
jgi:acid phosphatase family membrane protein YuiD